MTPGSLAIALSVFGLVFSTGYLLMLLVDRRQVEVDARLRAMNKAGSLTEPAPRQGELRPGSRSMAAGKWHETFGSLLPEGDAERKARQKLLFQAGIYSPGALSTFFGVKLALMIVPPLIGMLIGTSGLVDARLALLWGCVAGGFGMLLPTLWLEGKVRKRHGVLRRALPDFLDVTIVCLESGLSLDASLLRVTDELQIAHPVLAGELTIVQRNISLGATIDTALRRFAERSGFEGIRTLSSFVRESQRLGTALAEALRSHADMLRSQREQLAEEMAQKAAVKILFPTLLLILPAVFVVLAGPAAIQIQQAFSK
jgi:tight adherence protein C